MVPLDYLEALEAAVLKSWYDGERDVCEQCDGRGKGYFDMGADVTHAPDCIAFALIRKRELLGT